MSWALLFLYLILGGAIGLFSGLLGLGGGLILVPTLYWLLQLQSKTPDNMHIAIATSLAVMVVTSIVSTYSHAKRGGVLWKIFAWMGTGMLLGASTGPFISNQFSSRSLEVIFGFTEILVALVLLFSSRKKNELPADLNASFSKKALYFFAGAFAAFIGSMLGIGGGVVIVPFLLFLKVPSKNAVGTSAAATILTALIGTTSQLIFSYNTQLSFSLGYIYLPAAIFLAIGSLILTPYGVKLAHKLPERHLKIIFISVLVAFGLIMIL